MNLGHGTSVHEKSDARDGSLPRRAHLGRAPREAPDHENSLPSTSRRGAPVRVYRDTRPGRIGWLCDFRREGFGHHTPLPVAPSAAEWEAGAAAERLRVEMESRGETRRGQLFVRAHGGIVGALDAWVALRRWSNAATARGYQSDARNVRADFGARPLAALEPNGGRGHRLLRAWVRLMRARGLSPRTRRNRLMILRLAMKHQMAIGNVDALPEWPRPTYPGETLSTSRDRWIPEAEYRRLREHVSAHAGGSRRRLAAEVPAEIRRRKLFLDLMYYTGQHPADVAALTARDVNLLTGTIKWRNTKNTRSGRRRVHGHGHPVTVAEPLRLALAEASAERGGFVGPVVGPWPCAHREIQRAARAAGLVVEDGDTINAHDFRRSFAHELAARGKTDEEIGRALGHARGTSVTADVYRGYVEADDTVANVWRSAAVAPDGARGADVIDLFKTHRRGTR